MVIFASLLLINKVQVRTLSPVVCPLYIISHNVYVWFPCKSKKIGFDLGKIGGKVLDRKYCVTPCSRVTSHIELYPRVNSNELRHNKEGVCVVSEGGIALSRQ